MSNLTSEQNSMTREQIAEYVGDLWEKDAEELRDCFVLQCRDCQFGREQTRERYFWYRYGWRASYQAYVWLEKKLT